MFYWFKSLSSGNKIAFLLSGGVLATAFGYSAFTSFIAGSSSPLQPIFPTIISSPLPLLTTTPSPTPQPTTVITSTPVAIVSPPPPATSTPSAPAQPTHPAHSTGKTNQPEKQAENNKSNPGDDVKSMPAGAGALCHDGTYSFSLTRRGSCANHGGVDQWL